MKFSFDSIFYYVSNLDRAIDFYSRVLGFKLLSRDSVARFDVDGVLFELVSMPNTERLQGSGNARLCLKVSSVADAVRDLETKGVRTRSAEAKQGGILACFNDPDGNEICLWEYLKK